MADDASRIESHPSVRTYTVWTPGLIRSAKLLADGGDLALAADLCDAMFGDDRVSGVFSTRAAALFGRKLTFEPGRGRKKNAAIRAVEADEDWWNLFPEEELSGLLKWGLCLGIGIGQMRPVTKGSRIVPRLQVWHPRLLSFDDSTKQWMLTVDDAGRKIPITPGDGQWIFYTPYGSLRPWARGLWLGLARWYMLKSYAIDDWGRHSETASKAVLKAPAGADDHAKRRALAQDIRDARKNAVIGLPPNWTYELVETKADTQKIYEAQIDCANTSFSIAVLGNNLVAEVKGGSFAAATVGQDVALQNTRSDAETLSTTTHDQALAKWATWNFGSPDLAPWAMWDTRKPEDTKAKAETLKTAGEALAKWDAALVGTGKHVDKVALAESLGVPLLDGEADPPPQPVAAEKTPADATTN